MIRLVLLPGMDGTGELFGPFLRALGDVPAQVIDYPPDLEWDYADLEACVRSRLPHGEDFALLAESFSGPIGIAIAAMRPPRLRGLILCATFASNPLPGMAPLRRLLAAAPAVRVPPALMVPWLFPGRVTPELRRAHAHAVSRVAARVIRARAVAVLGVDRRADLAQVSVPMMYLRAARDRVIPSAAGRTIRKLRPDMEWVEFDAPHLLLQTEPAACAAATRSFLQRCTAGPGRG